MPQVRLKEEVQRFEKRVRDQVAPGSVDNLSALLVQNFNVMNSYYSENLAQSRTSARASVSIAVLGFVAILAGIIIALSLKQEMIGSVSVGKCWGWYRIPSGGGPVLSPESGFQGPDE